MLIIRNTSDVAAIANPAIRKLVALRFQQLHSTNELDSDPVDLVVLEARDSVLAIENAAGFPFLSSGLFDDLPFDHPDYVPPTEFIERHIHDNAIIFELILLTSDSGAGTALFVPNEEGIDTNLLAMCHAFATPAMSTP